MGPGDVLSPKGEQRFGWVNGKVQAVDYGSSAGVDRSAVMPLGAGTATASVVTVNYPFQFMVLQPVMQLLVSGSKVGAPVMLTASAQMRNESQ